MKIFSEITEEQRICIKAYILNNIPKNNNGKIVMNEERGRQLLIDIINYDLFINKSDIKE